jgi:hypothetical protein
MTSAATWSGAESRARNDRHIASLTEDASRRIFSRTEPVRSRDCAAHVRWSAIPSDPTEARLSDDSI